ncbi:hypothetical protein [Halalkalibacter krulwichiae]|uniref:hypothetical protein n=1 Tax=Halalkalibacter krulwichiae TaxID=199441 RepID=UPI000AD2E7FC|nr:hypothetical protein [Halalkalibacter krulwichiae]
MVTNEQIDDVAGFIRSQGEEEFVTELLGDHYNIQSKHTDHIKRILERYFDNR